MHPVFYESSPCNTSLNFWFHFGCYFVTVDVWWNVVANGPYGTQALYRLVPMRYTRLKMPSWKTGILKSIRANPVDQIRDSVLLIFILIG